MAETLRENGRVEYLKVRENKKWNSDSTILRLASSKIKAESIRENGRFEDFENKRDKVEC